MSNQQTLIIVVVVLLVLGLVTYWFVNRGRVQTQTAPQAVPETVVPESLPAPEATSTQ